MSREARAERDREAREWFIALGIFLTTLVVGFGLLGVGLMVAMGTLGNSTPDEPPTGDDYFRLDRLPPTCGTEVEEPDLLLEAEPEAMLLCADLTNKHLWTAPVDLVEGDLTELGDTLADLERAPTYDYACEMVGGPAYDLVLRFPGDRYATIHGDTGGCGVVTVGSGDYFGAKAVLDTALALVEEQRSRTEPPDEVPPVDLSCDHVLTDGGLQTSYTGEPGDVVRLVSCWQPNAPELGTWTESEVLTSDVQILARDVDRRGEAGGDPDGLRCPGGLRHHYFQHLVGETSWGDVLLIAGECRRFLLFDNRGDGDAVVWRPSPQAQRLLDQLRR